MFIIYTGVDSPNTLLALSIPVW